MSQRIEIPTKKARWKKSALKSKLNHLNHHTSHKLGELLHNCLTKLTNAPIECKVKKLFEVLVVLELLVVAPIYATA